MSTLQERINRRPTMRERQINADVVQGQIEHDYRQGLSIAQIAANMGLTVRHVNRLLATLRSVCGKPEWSPRPPRSPRPFSPAERAMRDEYAAGNIRIAALARKHGLSPQRMRYTLAKPPSVLR